MKASGDEMIDGRSFGMRGAPVLVALVLTLGACGGGGGDGGGGLQISVDRTALEFTTARSVEPAPLPSFAPAQIVHFDVSSGAGTYFAFIVFDRASTFTAQVDYPSSTRATATIALAAAPAVPVGDTTGHVTFRLCPDSACSSVAWERSLPYTIHMFAVSTTPVALLATAGGAVVSRALDVSPVDTSQRLYAAPSASTTWLSVVRDGSSAFLVNASPAVLSAGTYHGQVFVGAPEPYGIAVPVTFTVQ